MFRIAVSQKQIVRRNIIADAKCCQDNPIPITPNWFVILTGTTSNILGEINYSIKLEKVQSCPRDEIVIKMHLGSPILYWLGSRRIRYSIFKSVKFAP